MASGPSSVAHLYLSALFQSGTMAGVSDCELLERFGSRRGENDASAELAFATLLARHGAMVLRVCRAGLGDRHEAEDAFQATFLILATRARAIRRGASVGSWLHGVALRVSARARSRAARRQRSERRRAEMTTRITEAECQSPAVDDDSGRVLNEEIGRLPDRFRSAVVLCYLEGLTHEMAASQLGCPVGTIRSRLATARERLRKRLTRRGAAPSVIPMGLSGSAWIPAAESAALSMSVPVALVDATARGALRVGLGKGALTGIVSLEAIALTKGVLATMMTTKLMLSTATILVAGLVATGAGVAAFSALGRDQGLAGGPVLAQATPLKQQAGPPASRKPATRSPGPPPEIKQQMRRRSAETVRSLLREYEAEKAAARNAMQKAKTALERKALFLKQPPTPNPASYAGALLYEAEANPGTAAAEDALIWIVTNLPLGSMAERAKELIAQDHIQSQKIETLFRPSQINMAGSRATEQLFRAALAKNPDRKIRALACHSLARFLDNKASLVRLERMYDRAQREEMRYPISEAGWGRDYEDRLLKTDPEALEREAAALYGRVVKEFGGLPLPHPLPHLTGDLLLPARPTTYGAAAQAYLHELLDVGIGRPAPEIEGIDLDGRPMKLSDYRGRVVVIYFCMPTQLGANPTGRPATITENVRSFALRHANDAFALLGVTTVVGFERQGDRDAFKALVKASGLPARFWWDIGPDDKPGPIQTAWNARMNLYVLDHRGVIRYKQLFGPALLEEAVSTLLKEQRDGAGPTKKND